jgi:hypothetical protein
MSFDWAPAARFGSIPYIQDVGIAMFNPEGGPGRRPPWFIGVDG